MVAGPAAEKKYRERVAHIKIRSIADPFFGEGFAILLRYHVWVRSKSKYDLSLSFKKLKLFIPLHFNIRKIESKHEGYLLYC